MPPHAVPPSQYYLYLQLELIVHSAFNYNLPLAVHRTQPTFHLYQSLCKPLSCALVSRTSEAAKLNPLLHLCIFHEFIQFGTA